MSRGRSDAAATCNRERCFSQDIIVFLELVVTAFVLRFVQISFLIYWTEICVAQKSYNMLMKKFIMVQSVTVNSLYSCF